MSSTEIDTSKRFYFMTRTEGKAADYKAFTDGGETHIASNSYSNIFRIAQLNNEGEEQPCASFYEDGGKIYLAAAALMCGRKDADGRKIRLSFCRIFQKNGDDEKRRTYAAFIRLATSWNEVVDKMRNCLDSRNDIELRFDDEAFIEWLERDVEQKVEFSQCGSGDIVMSWAHAWPDAGCVLKWHDRDPNLITQTETDDAFYCLKKGERSKW